MIKESEYCSKLIEIEFSKPLVMIKHFNNSAMCWIFTNAYEEDKLKVKDHDHITVKYRESGHQYCTLNLNLNKKIPYCVS